MRLSRWDLNYPGRVNLPASRLHNMVAPFRMRRGAMRGRRLLEELRRVLAYERDTGHIRWRIRRQCHGGMLYPGDIAGSPKDGYIQIVYTDPDGVRHQFRAHRLAWLLETGKKPPKELDHEDRNRANNRWGNLREATRSQNNLNAKRRKHNISGKTGVSWVERDQIWMARLTLNKRIIELGRFDHVHDAIASRRAAELQYLGAYCPS